MKYCQQFLVLIVVKKRGWGRAKPKNGVVGGILLVSGMGLYSSSPGDPTAPRAWLGIFWWGNLNEGRLNESSLIESHLNESSLNESSLIESYLNDSSLVSCVISAGGVIALCLRAMEQAMDLLIFFSPKLI